MPKNDVAATHGEMRFPIEPDAEGITRPLLPYHANSEDVSAYYNMRIAALEKRWEALKIRIRNARMPLRLPSDVVAAYDKILSAMAELEEDNA